MHDTSVHVGRPTTRPDRQSTAADQRPNMGPPTALTLVARASHIDLDLRSANDSELAGCSVLIVDDHGPHRTLLLEYLGGLGCACEGASGGHEALAKLAQHAYDMVLLDLRMDDLDGMEVLQRAQDSGTIGPCIMMSAEGTILHAVEAIRRGAKDFLVKPFELEQLTDTMQRVLGTPANASTDGRDPRQVWRDRHAPKMLGDDPALLEVFLVLERIAHTDCTVLVTGESGTGKELVARALHDSSPRSAKPFVPVNCGAIPETLIESELFGHAKGAFSGATQAREGRFAAADGGTLFLDEIGEMSLAVQVKFLRVLQEQEYVPVGETRPRKCDVRIIAATHKNLERMAEEGSFRADLFYRLNLIPIHLPPLRRRPDDVSTLALHFVQRMRERGGTQVCGIHDDALAAMMAYDWPGNVRELENTIERMALLHDGSGVLTLSDLPTKIRQRQQAAAAALGMDAPPVVLPRVAPELRAVVNAELDRAALADPVPPGPPRDPMAPAGPGAFVLPEDGIDLRAAVEAFEMSLIEQALARTGGNKNQASILLGMNRTTLVEKLRKRRARA